MDSPTSGSTTPPPLPGQSSTPPATPPVPSTPPIAPDRPTPTVNSPTPPTPITPPPMPSTPAAPPTLPTPPPVPSVPVHTPATPPVSPSAPSTPPVSLPHPPAPPTSPASTGSLVVPPSIGGENKKEEDDKPLVPPLSPPPSGNAPDSLSKLSSDHADVSTSGSGNVPVSTTSPDPVSHDKPAHDLPQIGAAPMESRMTHEVQPDEAPKKGHKGLAVIIIVGIILLALGGVAYAASSCSISIPGLSSLFGCETDTSLSSDQGFTDTTTP